MKRYFSYIIAIGTLATTSMTSAQTASSVDTVKSLQGIEIQTSVDRAEIYIGDLINYKVIIVYDSTYNLIPPPLGANLGAFDVKDFQSDITSRLPDGRMKSENLFVLSTFTTGDYLIPPIPVIFDLPNGTRKALLSESVPIKVLSLLFNADDSVDIKPLKPPHEFKRDLTKYYVWGGVGLLVFLAVAFLVWNLVRRRKAAGQPIDLRPGWEIAFERLALLKQKNFLLEASFKQYYIELSEIIRFYYEKMYGLKAIDMTTEEFLDCFEKMELPESVFAETRQFLQQADLVKFAKLEPELERAESDFEVVHQLVERVRADHERRLQIEMQIQRQRNSRNTVSEVAK